MAFNAIISVPVNKRKLFQWLLIKNHVLFHNQRYLINNVNVIEEETACKNKQLSNVRENKSHKVILAGNVPCFVLIPKETRSFFLFLFFAQAALILKC